MYRKTHIYEMSDTIAQSFIDKPGIHAVAIGGSIAQRNAWENSDLELGLLVDEYQTDLPYFNVINGRGVECIQILKSEMVNVIKKHEKTGNYEGIMGFSMKMYQCKIISDPDGIFLKIKKLIDKYLFSEENKAKNQKDAIQKADAYLKTVQKLLDGGKYKSALAMLRLAVNELLLAFYWHHGILPRSQNRTVYLLKKQSPLLGGYD